MGWAMEAVLAAWRDVGLDELRGVLDAQALEIAERREGSSRSHKELVAATKAFMKAGEAERLAGEKKILKAYQQEVDSLTKRAKYSERAFTALYAKVHEAPDPVPHLETAAEMSPELAKLREENDSLQDDLLRYRLDVKEIKQETSEVKNQSTMIAELQEKLKDLQQRYDEDTKDTVAAQDALRAQQESEALRQQLEAAQLAQRDLKRQLEVSAEAAAQARQAHDASQARLLEIESNAGELHRAKDAETELVDDELLRAKQRIAELEAAAARLKEQSELAARPAGGGGISAETPESKLASKEAEVVRLAQELRRVSAEREQESATLREAVTSLQSELGSAASELRGLQQQLSARPSVEDHRKLQAQLRVMRRTMAGGGGDDDEDGQAMGDTEGLEIAEASVEGLLTRKVRQLEQRISVLNASVGAKEGEVAAATRELAELRAWQQEKTALIARLEEDLSQAAGASDAGRPTNDGGGGSGSGGDGGGKEMLRELMPTSTPASAAAAGRGGGAGSEGGSGLLGVVTAQRDRLKKQVLSLEERVHAAEQDSESSRARAELLDRERLDLTAKLRFVQSYAGTGGNSAASAGAAGGGGGATDYDYRSGLTARASGGGRNASHDYDSYGSSNSTAGRGGNWRQASSMYGSTTGGSSAPSQELRRKVVDLACVLHPFFFML